LNNFAKILGIPKKDLVVASYRHEAEVSVEVSFVMISGGQYAELGETLDVELWRFVNNHPLVEYDDDILSCAIYSSVKRLPWFMYGLKAKTDTNVEFLCPEALKLCWLNEDISSSVKGPIPHKLLVHINLLSANGNFYSMCLQIMSWKEFY
jgi:hypothetical protein